MTEDYEDVVHRHQGIVDERHGRIIGLVVFTVEDDALLVHNVAVDPACQERGVGRGLLEHAKAAARHAGYHAIALDTTSACGEPRAVSPNQLRRGQSAPARPSLGRAPAQATAVTCRGSRLTGLAAHARAASPG